MSELPRPAPPPQPPDRWRGQGLRLALVPFPPSRSQMEWKPVKNGLLEGADFQGGRVSLS